MGLNVGIHERGSRDSWAWKSHGSWDSWACEKGVWLQESNPTSCDYVIQTVDLTGRRTNTLLLKQSYLSVQRTIISAKWALSSSHTDQQLQHTATHCDTLQHPATRAVYSGGQSDEQFDFGVDRGLAVDDISSTSAKTALHLLQKNPAFPQKEPSTVAMWISMSSLAEIAVWRLTTSDVHARNSPTFLQKEPCISARRTLHFRQKSSI